MAVGYPAGSEPVHAARHSIHQLRRRQPHEPVSSMVRTHQRDITEGSTQHEHL